jgi:group I intron endonuclease
MFVYKIVNTVNGKMYIGKTIKSLKERFRKHKRCAEKKINRYLYDAMNHYGAENFYIDLIEECSSIEELNEREVHWIHVLNTVLPHGYNMTPGGDGGDTLKHWPSEKRRQLHIKQGLSRRGIKWDEERKRRMSEISKEREKNKTLKQKQAISEKISSTLKEKGISPPDYTKWKKGQKGAFSGRSHSDETKLKLSAARTGKTYEDLWPEDVILDRKNQLREAFSGDKNPRFIPFSKESKLKILNALLETPDIKLDDLVKVSNPPCRSKVRQLLKSIGISNFQLFKRQDSSSQRQIIEAGIKHVDRDQ